MTKTPQRFAWAAACMQLSPSHRVLELGCGAGLLVAEMLPYLRSGVITAIDKSGPMISKAIKRNAAAVSDGKVSFHQVALAEFDSKQRFDVITGFNFNVFTKFPAEEMLKIKKLLKPGCRLLVFYQAPYPLKRSDARPIVNGLQDSGFETSEAILKKFDHGNALLIGASLSKN